MLLYCYAIIVFLSSAVWRRFPSVLSLVSGGRLTIVGEAQRQDLMAMALLFLIPVCLVFWKHLGKEPAPRTMKWGTLLCGGFFVLGSLALFLFQLHYHSPAGVKPAYGIEIAFYAGAGVLWGLAWMLGGSRPRLAAGAAFLALAVFLTRQTLAFPLDNGFSDMLPLIRNAGAALLQGKSPYGFTHLAFQSGLVERLRATYLPGMILSYLPAVALGFDPRYLNLFFWAAFCWFGCLDLDVKKRAWGVALLSLYLLNPWIQYRQDLYLPAWLWTLPFIHWAMKREHPWLSALAFGWSMATYQFSWLLFVIYLAWSARSRGWRPTLLWGAAAAAAAVAVLLPFTAWDFRGFSQGVFHHWANEAEIDQYNLVYWLWNCPEKFRILQGLQAALLLFCVRLAWRNPGSKSAFWGVSALFLALFCLANASGRHYFFFMATACLFIAAAEWPSAPPDPGRAPSSEVAPRAPWG